MCALPRAYHTFCNVGRWLGRLCRWTVSACRLDCPRVCGSDPDPYLDPDRADTYHAPCRDLYRYDACCRIYSLAGRSVCVKNTRPGKSPSECSCSPRSVYWCFFPCSHLLLPLLCLRNPLTCLLQTPNCLPIAGDDSFFSPPSLQFLNFVAAKWTQLSQMVDASGGSASSLMVVNNLWS